MLIVVVCLSVSIGIMLSGVSSQTLVTGGVGNSSSETQRDPNKDSDDEEKNDQPQTPEQAEGPSGGNQDVVKKGRLPGYEDRAINTDPDTVSYLINGEVSFSEPDAIGNIKIENNPGNLCAIQVTYYIEETTEKIYCSPILMPGEYIDADKLTEDVKKGIYPVNAVISIYDLETLELQDSSYENVTVIVEDKLFGIF